ncbi:SusC/RagA family TonB-linked outer membrane protein, partial [Mariniphaga sediminis]|uniref:SusC/RagA family TonB-linked outer membrane protein n=1 Tax=Mariniphaga sediminis TaxID=1628158 RepID=UPI0035657E61
MKILQQQGTVSGKVTDSDELPLPGVTVVVKGTTQGTVTNADGEYFLTNVPAEATLVFSFVGMRTQEISVGAQTNINVAMEVDAIGIEEVVAVGYGTQKKANLTGAVGVANSERLENRTITSLGQGLQGVIPGLNITYQSGDPNEAADFNIRGYESINGGSPLILVDGVPMDVEKVNPNDIKSISVLKDASSAAIYGARAAFGVVLVETKKGQIGKTNINFSAQATMQKAIYHNYEPLKDNGTARQVYSDAFKLTRGRDLFPIPVIEAALAYQEMSNPTEDDAWFYYNEQIWSLNNTYMKDLAMRDFAPQQQYDFSISGASEKASYYVSFGVIDKEGFFRYGNENYKRYNALSKVEFKVNNWLTLEEKISFSSVLNDNPHKYGDQAFYDLIGRPFYNPNFFPNLTYYKEPGDHDQYAHLVGMYSYRNPIAYMKYGGRDTRTDNDIWLSQNITITPVKGLKINGDFSYRYFWSDDERVQSKVDILKGAYGFNLNDPNIIFNGWSANDYIENSFDKNTYYVFNTFAEYSREDLGNHSIKALVGFNQEYGSTHGITTRSTQLLIPNIHSLTATTGTKTNSDTKNEIMLRGLFYRLNYSYKDKYLFEANGRYDGTSRFPKESRFGFFPSFSMGWRISEENFMENVSWLDNLKLRASWGVIGNTAISPYQTQGGLTRTEYTFGEVPGLGFVPNEISNPNLGWEKTTTTNLGLDFGVLNNRINGTLEVYQQNTSDLLLYRQLPVTSGYERILENVGETKNSGIEATI